MLTRQCRNDFASCSSGNGPQSYYQTKGHAIARFNAALAQYGLQLHPNHLADWHNDTGCTLVPIVNDDDNDGPAVWHTAYFAWYRMPESGRWEIIGYIA